MREIYLCKKRLRQNLILSIIYGCIFFLNLFFNFKSYTALFYGLLFIITVVVANYEEKMAYLILTQEGIKQNVLLRKKHILWEEVRAFKDFAGDLKIVGKAKTITIPKTYLNESDLEIVQNFLKVKINS